MLILPDFKEKRILLVHAEYGKDSLLQLTNDNIRFVQDGETVDQMSCHSVFAVFIVGDMSITTALLKKLSSYGVSVFFLNHNLATRAAVMAAAEGNYLLRQRQYTSDGQMTIAAGIVINKLENQEAVLQSFKKSYDVRVFDRARKQAAQSPDLKRLLGIEGNASKEYFQSLFGELGWVRRAPQTKEDIPNLLLDIGYSYLLNFCDALLRLFGFDTYKGCYHQLFFQRKSLSCDIMEPMRPLIDRQLVKSYHLGQIKEKDFVFKNGRFDFREGYKTVKPYSAIFFEEITGRREDMYRYILNFYRHVMDREKYTLPSFTV
ncbi:CRISPR-associated endonuclease Cas1 [Candidatus Gottesmanbacteria bacterium]|nr:CRISPR-associated endonuclease Cas1 [Candidatus Gottesmanbacteria bacterium]